MFQTFFYCVINMNVVKVYLKKEIQMSDNFHVKIRLTLWFSIRFSMLFFSQGVLRKTGDMSKDSKIHVPYNQPDYCQRGGKKRLE